MTSKASKCSGFREDVLYPLQDAVESMESYYGMPGAKENKYLRNAGTQVECALYNLTRALDIFESKEEM